MTRTYRELNIELQFLQAIESRCKSTLDSDVNKMWINRGQLRRLRLLAGHKPAGKKKLEAYRKRVPTILRMCQAAREHLEVEVATSVAEAIEPNQLNVLRS